MKYVDNMPTAKTLYARRLIDNKEFLVCSGFLGGVNGVSSDGERASLTDGQFELYRR